MITSLTSDQKRACAELSILLLSSILYIFSENVLGYRLVPVLILLIGWGGYLSFRIRRQPKVLRRWGIRYDNIWESVRLNAAVLVGGVLLLVIVRYMMGWQSLPVNSLIIFGLYPVWAFVQQFALEGLVVRNLQDLDVPRVFTVLMGAVGYGLAHLPDLPLSAITAGVGIVWVSVFLRTPNLIPLSITHAVLGTCTYYWILERDPVKELFETTLF